MRILKYHTQNALPDLETSRLWLRQRQLTDIEDIFAFASLEKVSRPAGFAPVKTLEEEHDYLTRIYPENLAKQDLPSGYAIVLKAKNKVIGSIDFNFRRSDDVFELGYILHPDYWGQGLLPEAGQAIVEIGFTHLQLYKIEIRCDATNRQSQRVAEKLGFKYEGCIRGRKDSRGRHDELYYGLLKSEWEKKVRS